METKKTAIELLIEQNEKMIETLKKSEVKTLTQALKETLINRADDILFGVFLGFGIQTSVFLIEFLKK